jgi:hypothetical protein
MRFNHSSLELGNIASGVKVEFILFSEIIIGLGYAFLSVLGNGIYVG